MPPCSTGVGHRDTQVARDFAEFSEQGVIEWNACGTAFLFGFPLLLARGPDTLCVGRPPRGTQFTQQVPGVLPEPVRSDER